MPYPDRKNAWPYDAQDPTQVPPKVTRLACILAGLVLSVVLYCCCH